MRGSLTLTLSQREGEFLNPKSKTTARTGWALEMEIDTQPCSAGRNGSVLAYSTTGHRLSRLTRGRVVQTVQAVQTVQIVAEDPVTLGIGFSISPLATNKGKQDARFTGSQAFKKMRVMAGKSRARTEADL